MEYFKDNYGALYQGDVLEELKKLPDESVNMCVTSPPYWNLRDYGIEGQIGLEKTPEEYIDKLVEVFREVYRVLKKDGILWLNMGDSYWGSGCGPKGNIGCPNNQRVNNSKGRKYPKGSKYKSGDLVGIPWMLSFALRDDGWYLRQDIIWAKKSCMPESVKNRCTKSHEYIFLLSKNKKYYYNYEAISEPLSPLTIKRYQTGWNGDESRNYPNNKQNNLSKYLGHEKVKKATKRNKRDVWWVATKPLKLAHFSTFPPALIEPTILAGCPEGGMVLDPFIGSGTTAIVAESLNRRWVGIELSEKYCEIVKNRVNKNKDIFTEFNISKE